MQSSRRTCRLRHGGWAIVGVVVGILVVGCAIWLVSTRSQFRTARTRWDGWFIAEHAVRSGQTEEGREGEREEKVLNGGEGDGTVETELRRQRKETAQPSAAQLSAPLSSVLSS